MKDMSLGDLLRYGLAGGNFVALLYLSYPQEFPALDSIGTSSMILGASLLIGGIVYSLHRALPYPLVIFPLALKIAGHQSGVPDFEKERDAALETDKGVQRHAPEWGAQVHFLYALGWSTLLVPSLGSLTAKDDAVIPGLWMYATAGVYMIAAAVHHVRLIRFIKSSCCRDA